MAKTSLNPNGLIIEPQDLSPLSPGSENHGRLYNHDGSSSITLSTGDTASDKGYYMWDNPAGGWNPLKLTVADADLLDGIDSTGFVQSAGGGDEFHRGTLANRPAAGTANRWYFTTDNNGVYFDDGAAWNLVAEHPGNIGAADLGFDPATQSELAAWGLDDARGAGNTVTGDVVFSGEAKVSLGDGNYWVRYDSTHDTLKIGSAENTAVAEIDSAGNLTIEGTLNEGATVGN